MGAADGHRRNEENDNDGEKRPAFERNVHGPDDRAASRCLNRSGTKAGSKGVNELPDPVFDFGPGAGDWDSSTALHFENAPPCGIAGKLGHANQIDDCAATNAEEMLRCKLSFQLAKRLAEDLRRCVGVDYGVVVRGLDPLGSSSNG